MKFSLRILGSSSALPTSKRFPSAHLLNVNERFYLIDCGEGTQMQLRRYGVRFGKLHEVFISHLHGDHVFGIFGLLSSLELMGRTSPLTIFAPKDFSKILDFYKSTFGQTRGFPINFKPLPEETGIIYHDKRVKVTSFPLTHKVPTFGFLFKENDNPRNIKKPEIEKHNLTIPQILKLRKGENVTTEQGVPIQSKEVTLPPYHARSYAYLTDTIAKNSLAKLLENTDLLYHEATFLHDDLKLARETCHSTARQAAEFAEKAGVKKLLIGHFSGRYNNSGLFTEEAREIFQNTTGVNDGDEFEVERTREKE